MIRIACRRNPQHTILCYFELTYFSTLNQLTLAVFDGSELYRWLGTSSPVSGARQRQLNLNFANTLAFQGVLGALIEKKEAIINRAIIPIASGQENQRLNFEISQFRHEDFDSYSGEPISFFAYPVLASFEPDARVGGVIASNMFWRLIFSTVLPVSVGSFVCVVENSFNQTLSYIIKGPVAAYLGDGDFHDDTYDDLVASTDMSDYARRFRNPAVRSYTSLPLNTEFGKYALRIYPTKETEGLFASNKPWVYTSIVVAVSLFISILFAVFAYFVERRQRIVMTRVVRNAEKTAATERDLNEFLAHEIRNPLSSAIVAHSFITSAVADPNLIRDDAVRTTLQADHKIVHSSLKFIDDFLRSMLLMYRASANKLEVGLSPTNLYREVFEPVADILHPRNNDIKVIVECPETLGVMTDALRLEQVLLNLGRNSSKFVTSGFIRLKASLVSGMVELCVEDSGAGVPVDRRELLFKKYHTSLDVVTQGNGIGLCLCKNLVVLLKGDIWLDESYDSGIPGSPGARFVVSLKMPPLLAPDSSHSHVVDPIDPGNAMNPTTVSASASFNSAVPALVDSQSLLPENLSVLFVDDDAILRKLFIRSLGRVRPDWTIKGVSSGEAALELVTPGALAGAREDEHVAGGDGGDIEDQLQHQQPNRFDLIFVDQYMASTEPRLLGTETVTRLRAGGTTSTLCGLSANDLEKEFLDAGADYFLLKPLPYDRQKLEGELLRITGWIRSSSNHTHNYPEHVNSL
jgi:signal transduction histidine kinase/CheY-like chemotaxis protein